MMTIKTLPSGVARELLAVSPEATIITDADGMIVFVNHEAETLFG